MTARRPTFTAKVDDPTTDRILRDQRRAIDDLHSAPGADLKVVSDVTLDDGTETTVAHSLGRLPRAVLISPPRGPSATGMIEEMRSGSLADRTDRRRYVVLKATGFGATVAVDVVFL